MVRRADRMLWLLQTERGESEIVHILLAIYSARSLHNRPRHQSLMACLCPLVSQISEPEPLDYLVLNRSNGMVNYVRAKWQTDDNAIRPTARGRGNDLLDACR